MYRGKKVGAIILARMRSSRLPGKVMLSLRGKPALQHSITRLRKSKYLNNVIVATTSHESCDPIAQLCLRLGCKFYRGSEKDIVTRFEEASRIHNFDVVVRITGDCPMVDWTIVDDLIELYFENECDYCSNVLHRTWPKGFDVEVMNAKLLKEIKKNARGADRSHITTYFYQTNLGKFRMSNLDAPKELWHPDYRVTLDTLEDYTVLHTLFDILAPGFTAADVTQLLEISPCLRQINVGVGIKDLSEG